MQNTTVQDVEKQDFLWVVVGDIHDDTRPFAHIPELSQADGIIVSGDMTNCGGVKEVERVLSVAQSYVPNIMAQIGNMDRSEVTDWLAEKDWNLHAHARELTQGVGIFGVGASVFTPFGTPSEFPESHFAAWLDDAWKKARQWPKRVLISHNPPKDTLCDAIGGGVHVGSVAVRDFILEHQPDVCICGHIHEAKGIDRLGRTILVNPGNLAAGGYVLLRVNDGQLSVELKEGAHSPQTIEE